MRNFGLVGTMLWAMLLLLGSNRWVTHRELVHGNEERRHSYLFAVTAVLPIILWAGFREGAGYVDTNAYIRFYEMVPTGMAELSVFLKSYGDDPGFTIFTSLIKLLFGESYTPFLLITATVQCLIVAFFLRKYSSNFCMSFFLFVASADYFSWIFNGMRQFFAVVITVAGFRYLLEGKRVKYVLIVLLASTIHMSALLMLPVMLVVRGKPWNLKTILAIMLTIGILFATSQFTSILNQMMQNTQYSESVSSWDDDGTNPIRVMIHAVPTVLAFIGRKQIAEQKNSVMSLCVNMSIISTMLWLVSMVTSGIYMGRLPIYAGIYNYILLPYEIDVVFDKRSARVVKDFAIVMYLAFYYYQLHFAWGVL